MSGITSAVRRAGYSTNQWHDGLTVLHLPHLEEHGKVFLTELFNLSVAEVYIPTIWKKSVPILILRPEKPSEKGRSYRPVLLLCPATKIQEQFFLPTTVEVLGTRPSQNCYNARYSTTSWLYQQRHSPSCQAKSIYRQDQRQQCQPHFTCGRPRCFTYAVSTIQYLFFVTLHVENIAPVPHDKIIIGMNI